MKIMLDAGHGINTPGKRTPDGMREFEFNSVVAVFAKELLLGYEDTQVIFSHDPTGKTDVPLAERKAKAEKEKVDAVVSIHANAFGDDWNEANGIETFISEDRMPFTELELAAHIQNHLIRETGRRNRGVKRGNLHMTKVSNMIPSVLCELGFMTNKEEAALLKTASYREKCAQAIVNGLVEQYNLKPKAQAKKELACIKTGSMPIDVAEKIAEELKKKYGWKIVHVLKA
jgi:N-acetylmuramoyl-L-alanine amidase